MTSFTDPREHVNPDAITYTDRTTTNPDELEELRQLCRDSHLYEVERWIQEDRPLQLQEARPTGRRRWSSALEIALEDGNHALVLLLLCNGYDANRERHCPLNQPLEDRRIDLLDLLLEWGADPQQVDLSTLFGTYDSDLFERFRKLGVDLTAGHELAVTLAHHTSNTPLFGYARRQRKEDPEIQRELNIALGYHAREGNERGANLCLWAGADPHARAPDLHYDEDESLGVSAVYRACSWGHRDILELLGPDPDRDDFDKLYWAADTAGVVECLADIALPEDEDAVIRRRLCDATIDWNFGYGSRGRRILRALERLFNAGLRWTESSKEEIRRVRGCLLRAPEDTFVDAMKLLATKDYCSPAVLHELGRTPAIRRRMKEVGFIPPETDNREERSRWRRQRPTRYREVLKKVGIEIPKRSRPKRPLPHVVHIGRRRQGARKLRMDRQELFERVWSTPVYKLAEQWGLSGTGLRKACQRLNVPTPGRGYWQKVNAGKRVGRPKLPKFKAGEAEEIVVWTSD